MLIGGILVAVLTAVLIAERFAYRPLRNAPRLAPLITAIGVSIFLQEFVRLFYGEIPGFPNAKSAVPLPSIEIFTGQAIDIGGDLLHPACRPIFTLVALAICWAFLWWFVNRTRLGRAMLATSQDPDTARLMGIDVDRIIVVAFALGAALAAVAGRHPRAALRQHRLPDRLPRRAQGVHRRRARRHRQHQRRRARRPRPRRGRGHGDRVHARAVRRVGLEGRLGVRLLILVLVFRPQGLLGAKVVDRA